MLGALVLRYRTFGIEPLERIRCRQLFARSDVRRVRVPVFPDRDDGPWFSLAYADADRGGAGPVLVGLPGGPGLASVVPFLRVRRRLTAAGFRVLMPEHRGIGLSRLDDDRRPLPVDAVRSRYAVADVLRVLDAAGARTALLLGTSYGGYMALRAALRGPDRGLVTDAELTSIVPVVYEMSGAIATLHLLRKVAAGQTTTWRQLARLAANEAPGGRRPFTFDGDPALAIFVREIEHIVPDGEPFDRALTLSLQDRFGELPWEPEILPDTLDGFSRPTLLLHGARGGLHEAVAVGVGMRDHRPRAQLIRAYERRLSKRSR